MVLSFAALRASSCHLWMDKQLQEATWWMIPCETTEHYDVQIRSENPQILGGSASLKHFGIWQHLTEPVTWLEAQVLCGD